MELINLLNGSLLIEKENKYSMTNNKVSILFNAMQNTSGGGLKNSFFFILNNLKNKRLDGYYIINEKLLVLLKDAGVSIDNKFLIISKKNRKNLKKIENHVDLVYTMAGPTYLKFKAPHILGISNPYLTHAKFFNFKHGRTYVGFFRTIVKTLIQYLFFTKADFYVFQTQYSQHEFCKRKKLSITKTVVIPNAWDAGLTISAKKKEKQIYTIYAPGPGFSHKGLDLLPRVAMELNNIGCEEFIIYTHLSEKSSVWKLFNRNVKKYEVQKNFKNIGTVPYSNVSKLYANAELILIPSLLETFSATYLEAIQFNKKLIVHNTPFSKEICGNYANYSNFFDYELTAKLIENRLRSNHNKYSERQNILDCFINQEDRYNLVCATLEHYNEKHAKR
jgi:glycosyltransferase involved in cell wall biosynthesis